MSNVTPLRPDRSGPALDAFNAAAERVKVTFNNLMELAIDERTRPHPAEVKAYSYSVLVSWFIDRLEHARSEKGSLGDYLSELVDEVERKAQEIEEGGKA